MFRNKGINYNSVSNLNGMNKNGNQYNHNSTQVLNNPEGYHIDKNGELKLGGKPQQHQQNGKNIIFSHKNMQNGHSNLTNNSK